MNEFQREVLWLLHTLCANTSQNERSFHEQQAEAYRAGYVEFYNDRLNEEEHAEQIETDQILMMFRVLNNACNNLSPPSELRDRLRFEGFDGNGGTHGSYARYLNSRGMYEESNGQLNSHSSATLPRYRRMLRVLNNRQSAELTIQDLEEIADA